MWRLLRWLIVVEAFMFASVEMVDGLARLAPHEILAPYIEMWHLAERAERSSCPTSSISIAPYNNVAAKVSWCELASRISGHVTAYFESDTLKHVVAFTLQPNQLYYGDLVRCWGAPDEAKFVSLLPPTQVLSARWKREILSSIVVPYGVPVSYLHRVVYLSLEAEPPPCEADQ